MKSKHLDVNTFHLAKKYQEGEVMIILDKNLLKTNQNVIYLTVNELKRLIELAGESVPYETEK